MMTLTNLTLFKTQSLIDGNWVDGDDGKTIRVVNPFNAQQIAEVASVSQTQTQEAVIAADKAQKAWAALSHHQRSALLHKWADLIDANTEDLAILMTLEQGKPLKEARGEIAYANSYIRWFAEEGKRIYGDTIPAMQAQQRITVLKQPVGVCAAITPWNFPAAMITRKVAPALVAGCTMIVKPAAETPLSALALAELANQAGIPKGVLQVINGDAATIGSVLTQDERVHKLSFTGSTEVGRLLMSQSANTVKKLSLELGGNAPFIVFADADLEKAATGLIASKYRNAGQTCICANRIFVEDSIKKAFIKILITKVQALQVGDGMDETTDVGPLINQRALHKVQSLLFDALDKGAILETGGDVNQASPLSFNPTILSNISNDMDIAHEEIFGPIAPIISFQTEAEVLEKANDTIYGLAAYFYTNDVARSWRMSEGLEYGMVGHNTGAISSVVAPFGGVKQSGFGREGSKYGIEEYVVTKYWCTDIG